MEWLVMRYSYLAFLPVKERIRVFWSLLEQARGKGQGHRGEKALSSWNCLSDSHCEEEQLVNVTKRLWGHTAFRRAFPKGCTFFQICQQTIKVEYRTQEVTASAFLSVEERIPCSAHSGITDIFSLLSKDFHSLDLVSWPSKQQYSICCIIITCSNTKSPRSDSLLDRRDIQKCMKKHNTHLCTQYP